MTISEGTQHMIQTYKIHMLLIAENILGRDKELLYLTTLSYAKIIHRRWQMNNVGV
jgi:hypothetical protein